METACGRNPNLLAPEYQISTFMLTAANQLKIKGRPDEAAFVNNWFLLMRKF
jgi:hypothetical protein